MRGSSPDAQERSLLLIASSIVFTRNGVSGISTAQAKPAPIVSLMI